MNTSRLTILVGVIICCFLMTSSSMGEQVAPTSSRSHLQVVLTSTAQNAEAAKKNAERLKTDFVYPLLRNIGFKATIKSNVAEAKVNTDNSYTYKLTMTGDVDAVQQHSDHVVAVKHPVVAKHDPYLSITGLSLSSVTGTRQQGPYDDIKIVISSAASK